MSSQRPLRVKRPGGGNGKYKSHARDSIFAVLLPQSEAGRARLFLLLACFWPIMVLALFAASSPRFDRATVVQEAYLAEQEISQNIRSVLDRVDVMGYGPTHPRIGVVLIGNNQNHISATIESLLRYTDYNRIFVICVVVEGMAENPQFLAALQKLNAGVTPHWHGLRPDVHKSDEKQQHSQKIHVLFNPTPVGISQSRHDGAQFIQLLSQQHERSGLKSTMEDLILVQLRAGVLLKSARWLAAVTNALIVPPPISILAPDAATDTTTALKLANAVSFQASQATTRISFDIRLGRLDNSEPTASDMNESNGVSYLTPVLNGWAFALRLDTFFNVPMYDLTLAENVVDDGWMADVDLSLNLWLCGDGIDVIHDVDVLLAPDAAASVPPPAPQSPELIARLSAFWMDEHTSKRYFNAYTQEVVRLRKQQQQQQQADGEFTYLEWRIFREKARHENPHFQDLNRKCRTFDWFLNHVNTDIAESFNRQTAEIALPRPILNVERKPPPLSKEAVPEQKQREAQPTVVAHGTTVSKENMIQARMDADRKKPSKPLCKECLEIVMQAPLMDISFVDVSNGHREHPHKGALDAEGKPGYVPDEMALRKNPPTLLNLSEAELEAQCSRHDDTYRMLTEKVVIDTAGEKAANESGKRRDTIFCLVNTFHHLHDRIPRIRETWG
jgi:hypothetical protein